MDVAATVVGPLADDDINGIRDARFIGLFKRRQQFALDVPEGQGA